MTRVPSVVLRVLCVLCDELSKTAVFHFQGALYTLPGGGVEQTLPSNIPSFACASIEIHLLLALVLTTFAI